MKAELTTKEKDDAAIAEATATLDEDVRLARELRLGDAGYEAAIKKWLKVIRGGQPWLDGPRDIKALNDARIVPTRDMASVQHERVEFAWIKVDRAGLKAVLVELLNGEDVWIPRSQIHHVVDAENIILVTRWWASKNRHLLS